MRQLVELKTLESVWQNGEPEDEYTVLLYSTETSLVWEYMANNAFTTRSAAATGDCAGEGPTRDCPNVEYSLQDVYSVR